MEHNELNISLPRTMDYFFSQGEFTCNNKGDFYFNGAGARSSWFFVKVVGSKLIEISRDDYNKIDITEKLRFTSYKNMVKTRDYTSGGIVVNFDIFIRRFSKELGMSLITHKVAV
ncbi:MAG: hypothetical protein ACRC5M_06205 [Anaeroplasmataceae bacterium]